MIIASLLLSVVVCHDGDTCTVDKTHYRLAGIDCPELHQRGGRGALTRVRKLLSGDFAVKTSGTDMYGRTLATFVTEKYPDVNLELIDEGLCWAEQSRYHPPDIYVAHQTAARRAHRGIWAGSPTPPWTWRRQHRSSR